MSAERERLGVLAPLFEHRARVLPLGLALLLTYAYFVGEPAWNQNSRLALTRALVEQRTTIIDRYHFTTGDKSYRQGHFYCDKAPGASWAATLPYAAFYGLRRLTRAELPGVHVRVLDPDGPVPPPEERGPGDLLIYNLAHRIALYLCGLLTGVLPTVASAAAVFLLALRQAGNRLRPALVVALAFALATPAFPYATVFYGHALCGALILWAFTLLTLHEPTESTESTESSGRVPLVVGTLLGAAVVTEYPAAVPAILLVALAFLRHGPRFTARVIAGGVPWALALAAYHVAAFGHPLHTGYDFVYREEFAEGMRVAYGIHWPSLDALWQLSFGSYRGLGYLCPVVLLAAWGIASSIRRPSSLPRASMLTAIAIVVFYLLLNSGYYMWDGGAAYGPRHLVPMLGLLMLGGVAAWQASPRLFVVFTVIGMLHMLLGATATPEAPQHGNPIWEYAWPRARGAEAAIPGRATNLGLLLGLPGLISLLPLVAPWLWAAPTALKSDPE